MGADDLKGDEGNGQSDAIARITGRLEKVGLDEREITPISDALRHVAIAVLPTVGSEIEMAMAATANMERGLRAYVVGNKVRAVLAGIGTFAAAGVIAAKLVLTPPATKFHKITDPKNLPVVTAEKQGGGGGVQGCDPMQPNEVPDGLAGMSGTCVLQVKSDGKHIYDLRLEGAGLLMDPKKPYEVELKWGAARAVVGRYAPAISVKYRQNTATAEGSEVYSVVIDKEKPGVVYFINEEGETLVEATYRDPKNPDPSDPNAVDVESVPLSGQGNWAEVHLEDDFKYASKSPQVETANNSCAIKLVGGETKNYAAAMAIIAGMIALKERRKRKV